jgi:hypothetical protein
MRVVKALLGTDQPPFVASAAGVSIGWGIMTVSNIIYFSTGPSPPAWQAIGGGIAFGLVIMRFFFMAFPDSLR